MVDEKPTVRRGGISYTPDVGFIFEGSGGMKVEVPSVARDVKPVRDGKKEFVVEDLKGEGHAEVGRVTETSSPYEYEESQF